MRKMTFKIYAILVTVGTIALTASALAQSPPPPPPAPAAPIPWGDPCTYATILAGYSLSRMFRNSRRRN